MELVHRSNFIPETVLLWHRSRTCLNATRGLLVPHGILVHMHLTGKSSSRFGRENWFGASSWSPQANDWKIGGLWFVRRLLGQHGIRHLRLVLPYQLPSKTRFSCYNGKRYLSETCLLTSVDVSVSDREMNYRRAKMKHDRIESTISP